MKKPPENTAVIYARFSSSKQREASIEDQLRVCREWCSDRGYEVLSEYCDRAASGRTDDRPEFQRMVSNAGESEIVLVYAMDRFSRDQYDSPIYKKKLRDRGTRVLSATEAMPDGPESMLLESIYEAMAAMESVHNSQRTRRGMEGNALKCRHNGVRLFGYSLGDDGMYHVDDREAEVVREAFRMRASGKSYGWIAQRLAGMGVRTYRGTPCSYGMVKAMMGNEKYVGTYEWGGIRVEGGMPAILTREEFEMARDIRSAKRREHEEWTDYALSGKAVCGVCGANLVGVSGRGRGDVKYCYYRCSSKCSKAVRADVLESEVADAVRSFMTSPSVLETLTEIVRDVMASDDRTVERDRAKNELSEAEKEMSNLTDAVQKGMPYDMVKGRFDDLMRRRSVLEAKIETLSTEEEQFDAAAFMEFACSSEGLGDRQLVDLFVWKVRLFPDRVVVILNYDVKGKPAEIELPTGSHESAWLPKEPCDRTHAGDDRAARSLSSRPIRVSSGVRVAFVRGMIVLEAVL